MDEGIEIGHKAPPYFTCSVWIPSCFSCLQLLQGGGEEKDMPLTLPSCCIDKDGIVVAKPFI